MASEPGHRTKFRRALQVALARSFEAAGLKMEFQSGEVAGPQSDRDLGCVWLEGKRPSARAGILEEVFFQVRVLRQFKQDQGGADPRETFNEELERTMELLEDSLHAVIKRVDLEPAAGLETGELAGWHNYFTVTEIVTNHQQQYVQASLLAWAQNRTARGG